MRFQTEVTVAWRERINARDSAKKDRREGDDPMWERNTQNILTLHSVWERLQFTKYMEFIDIIHSIMV